MDAQRPYRKLKPACKTMWFRHWVFRRTDPLMFSNLEGEQVAVNSLLMTLRGLEQLAGARGLP